MMKQRHSPAETAVTILAAAMVLGSVGLGGAWWGSLLGLQVALACVVCLWIKAGGATGRAGLLPVMVVLPLLLQVVPLPRLVLAVLAPLPAAAWAEAGRLSWRPVSVDPAASTAALRWLFLGACTIVAVAHFCTDARCLRRLVTGLAITGAAICFLAVSSVPFKAERTVGGIVDLRGRIEDWRSVTEAPVQTIGVAYRQRVAVAGWQYEADAGVVGMGFGPYVTTNQFAAALAMCLPAMMAAWLRRDQRFRPSWSRIGGCVVLAVAAVLIVGPWAQSRAGVIAIGASVAAFLALAAETARGRLIGGAVTASLAGVVIVALVIMGGGLGKIANAGPAAVQFVVGSLLHDPRAVALQAAAAMFSGSPLLGTGLATYGSLFGRVVPGDVILLYAHNDYAQWLAETGCAGLVVAGSFVVSLGRRLHRFMRYTAPGTRLEPAAAWAGLAGIAVHSAFDWNLHLPANAVLAMVLVGIAMGSGDRGCVAPHGKPPVSRS